MGPQLSATDACTVAAYLEAACNGGDYKIDPLPVNSHYQPPNPLTANAFQCSSVVYELIAACADCQNRTYSRWSTWSTNCTTVYRGSFSKDIPAGTSVPAWAYIDPTITDNYNRTLAQSNLSSPESSASPKPTGSSSSGGQSSGPGATSLPKKHANTGAIAGGVVGGVVVLLAAIALAVWFIMRNRRRHIAQLHSPAGPLNNLSLAASPPPMSHRATDNTTPSLSRGASPRFYDPSDPTTYPALAGSPTIYTTNTGTAYVDSTYGTPSITRGQYTGAPEV